MTLMKGKTLRAQKNPAPMARDRVLGADFRLLGVALLEAIDAATGVQRLVLAGVKRVRRTGNFHLDEGVLVSVFPLDGFLAAHRRPGQDREVGRDVLENHVFVFGMDAGFHDYVPVNTEARHSE